MLKYLKKKYLLDDEGARTMRTAILTHTLAIFSNWLPLIYTFAFIEQTLAMMAGKGAVPSFWLFVGAALLCLPLSYLVHFIDYGALYVKVYNESAKKRISFANKLKLLPLAFFDRKDLSDLSATMMSDIANLETLYSHSIPQFYSALITIGLIALNLFVFNWKMALSVFWVLPIAFLFYYLSKQKQKQVFKEFYDLNREAVDVMQESIDGIQEIKSYQSEALFQRRFEDKCDEIHRTMVRMELLLGAVNNLAFMFLKLGLVTCAGLGVWLISRGELEPLYFMGYLMVSANIYTSIYEVMNNKALLNLLDQMLERTREIEEMPIQSGTAALAPRGHDIVFENVNFSYNEDVAVLKDISFTAKQGEITALVGPSGGGKSTISRLAARFWDATSGRVLLGGQDIATVDPETLLQHYAIVFQDVLLFNTSVMENIRIGKADATDDEVYAAARAAQCDAFVRNLPEGYQTEIGENGARLSGGERQRISIARAILKDAPVILLDEATASVDAENETKIQRALGELVKNKTVLIIAHRMRTILGVDRVIVVENGRISEQGSPSDLLASNGSFRRLVDAQLGG